MNKFKVELLRVCSMLELAGVENESNTSILKMFNLYGVDKTILKLNNTYNTNLRIGKFIIKSNNQNGFWSNDFGWCFDKASATGYSEEDLNTYRNSDGVAKPTFYDDASKDSEFIEYDLAVDFDS